MASYKEQQTSTKKDAVVLKIDKSSQGCVAAKIPRGKFIWFRGQDHDSPQRERGNVTLIQTSVHAFAG